MYNALAANYPYALTLADLGLLSLPRQQSKKPDNKKQVSATRARAGIDAYTFQAAVAARALLLPAVRGLLLRLGLGVLLSLRLGRAFALRLRAAHRLVNSLRRFLRCLLS